MRYDSIYYMLYKSTYNIKEILHELDCVKEMIEEMHNEIASIKELYTNGNDGEKVNKQDPKLSYFYSPYHMGYTSGIANTTNTSSASSVVSLTDFTHYNTPLLTNLIYYFYNAKLIDEIKQEIDNDHSNEADKENRDDDNNDNKDEE